METKGMVNLLLWKDLDWNLAALCARARMGGKTALRAAGTAIVLMVAETRKEKVCLGAQCGWVRLRSKTAAFLVHNELFLTACRA
jgi:hypothetical protein